MKRERATMQARKDRELCGFHVPAATPAFEDDFASKRHFGGFPAAAKANTSKRLASCFRCHRFASAAASLHIGF